MTTTTSTDQSWSRQNSVIRGVKDPATKHKVGAVLSHLAAAGMIDRTWVIAPKEVRITGWMTGMGEGVELVLPTRDAFHYLSGISFALNEGQAVIEAWHQRTARMVRQMRNEADPVVVSISAEELAEVRGIAVGEAHALLRKYGEFIVEETSEKAWDTIFDLLSHPNEEEE